MRRPTIKQLLEVRNVTSNGWGDGDYTSGMDRAQAERVRRALQSFDRWIESVGKFKFNCPLV